MYQLNYKLFLGYYYDHIAKNFFTKYQEDETDKVFDIQSSLITFNDIHLDTTRSLDKKLNSIIKTPGNPIDGVGSNNNDFYTTSWGTPPATLDGFEIKDADGSAVKLDDKNRQQKFTKDNPNTDQEEVNNILITGYLIYQLKNNVRSFILGDEIKHINCIIDTKNADIGTEKMNKKLYGRFISAIEKIWWLNIIVERVNQILASQQNNELFFSEGDNSQNGLFNKDNNNNINPIFKTDWVDFFSSKAKNTDFYTSGNDYGKFKEHYIIDRGGELKKLENILENDEISKLFQGGSGVDFNKGTGKLEINYENFVRKLAVAEKESIINEILKKHYIIKSNQTIGSGTGQIPLNNMHKIELFNIVLDNYFVFIYNLYCILVYQLINDPTIRKFLNELKNNAVKACFHTYENWENIYNSHLINPDKWETIYQKGGSRNKRLEFMKGGEPDAYKDNEENSYILSKLVKMDEDLDKILGEPMDASKKDETKKTKAIYKLLPGVEDGEIPGKLAASVSREAGKASRFKPSDSVNRSAVIKKLFTESPPSGSSDSGTITDDQSFDFSKINIENIGQLYSDDKGSNSVDNTIQELYNKVIDADNKDYIKDNITLNYTDDQSQITRKIANIANDEQKKNNRNFKILYFEISIKKP